MEFRAPTAKLRHCQERLCKIAKHILRSVVKQIEGFIFREPAVFSGKNDMWELAGGHDWEDIVLSKVGRKLITKG